MALSTAIVFGLLAIGFIWLHPKTGIPALLSESSIVSAHVRALLVVIILAPLLVGVLIQLGYGRFYEGELAIALTALGSVVVAATVALVSIVVLHRTESALFVKDRALAAATNGVVITDHLDPNESIIFVNDAFVEITGFDRDYSTGRNCRFLNKGLDNPPQVMHELRRLIASGDRGSVEIRNRRKDGTTFWNRLSLAPIENHEGTVTHLVGVVDDITAAREQGDRLQHALDEARISNAMRDAFIQVITHELRTPLNAALTWLRLMEIDDSVETRSKGLSVMAQSIESQSRLIDDLVDITRIATEGISLESEPVDARDLIETTIDELRPDIQEKQELVVQIEPGDYQAELDSVRVQQILRNLLSNASKYTPAGGRINVTLTREEAFLCLSVSDNGKGLSTEEIGHVFDPFWRANSNVVGLGVGLSIVAALVKAHKISCCNQITDNFFKFMKLLERGKQAFLYCLCQLFVVKLSRL
jgi:PAS domain S-box-containing protein